MLSKEAELKQVLHTGAKLEALKQHLQDQMRVRRREARQERLRLHQLENEEGYEGTRLEEDPLDLEAELTDQTDTDDDEEGEELDEEEEEEGLDDEEYGAEERVMKVSKNTRHGRRL